MIRSCQPLYRPAICCFCSGGPLGPCLSRIPAPLPANSRTTPRRERPPLLPVTCHRPASTSSASQITNSFTIRTSAKCSPNSFRIRTSKAQDLKPFRMNTSKKTGEGEGIRDRNPMNFFYPERPWGARDISAYPTNDFHPEHPMGVEGPLCRPMKHFYPACPVPSRRASSTNHESPITPSVKPGFSTAPAWTTMSGERLWRGYACRQSGSFLGWREIGLAGSHRKRRRSDPSSFQSVEQRG